jgi:hypothetical protein
MYPVNVRPSGGGHVTEHLEEPGVLHSPEGHAVQLLAPASLYVPAGQIAQPDTLS